MLARLARVEGGRSLLGHSSEVDDVIKRHSRPYRHPKVRRVLYRLLNALVTNTHRGGHAAVGWPAVFYLVTRHLLNS